MLFNSWQFLLFFPLVTGLYFALPHRFRWMLLLAASAVFYMTFVPAYILILAFTILVDYGAGRLISGAEGAKRRLWLALSLVTNLGILGFFKYFNFFNDTVRGFSTLLHWNYPIGTLAIVLPIGLSFHIFQSLSYTIEVYRGHQQPERHLGIYALYVMFYPQLVAGPIERPQNLLHQFREEMRFDPQRVTAGLQRMLWGLFKKVVVADRLAALVNPIFDHPHGYGGLPLVLAVVLFAVQIYCDFSGYSDIAIGAAQVMGFKLMENFRQPYFATSIREFWTRWHISLSTWFRDYLYIPLGGNRVPKWRWNLNLFVVFLLSGLWHGANWTFVAWGALHGAYLVAGIWTQPLRRRWAEWLGIARWPALQRAWQVGVTFSLVCLAWIFFRAASLADAWAILTHLPVGLGDQLASPAALASTLKCFKASRAELSLVVAVVAAVFGVQWLQRRGSVRALLSRQPAAFRWAVYQALVLALVVFGVYENQAFIYFQF